MNTGRELLKDFQKKIQAQLKEIYTTIKNSSELDLQQASKSTSNDMSRAVRRGDPYKSGIFILNASVSRSDDIGITNFFNSYFGLISLSDVQKELITKMLDHDPEILKDVASLKKRFKLKGLHPDYMLKFFRLLYVNNYFMNKNHKFVDFIKTAEEFGYTAEEIGLMLIQSLREIAKFTAPWSEFEYFDSVDDYTEAKVLFFNTFSKKGEITPTHNFFDLLLYLKEHAVDQAIIAEILKLIYQKNRLVFNNSFDKALNEINYALSGLHIKYAKLCTELEADNTAKDNKIIDDELAAMPAELDLMSSIDPVANLYEEAQGKNKKVPRKIRLSYAVAAQVFHNCLQAFNRKLYIDKEPNMGALYELLKQYCMKQADPQKNLTPTEIYQVFISYVAHCQQSYKIGKLINHFKLDGTVSPFTREAEINFVMTIFQNENVFDRVFQLELKSMMQVEAKDSVLDDDLEYQQQLKAAAVKESREYVVLFYKNDSFIKVLDDQDTFTQHLRVLGCDQKEIDQIMGRYKEFLISLENEANTELFNRFFDDSAKANYEFAKQLIAELYLQNNHQFKNEDEYLKSLERQTKLGELAGIIGDIDVDLELIKEDLMLALDLRELIGKLNVAITYFLPEQDITVSSAPVEEKYNLIFLDNFVQKDLSGFRADELQEMQTIMTKISNGVRKVVPFNSKYFYINNDTACLYFTKLNNNTVLVVQAARFNLSKGFRDFESRLNDERAQASISEIKAIFASGDNEKIADFMLKYEADVLPGITTTMSANMGKNNN